MVPQSIWVSVNNLMKFLDVFKNATTKLSGVYYPTSCWVLQELYCMTCIFKAFEEKSKVFKTIVAVMREKF